MKFLFLLAFWVASTLHDDNIILLNKTGLVIARIQIDHRTLEGNGGAPITSEVLLSVTPVKHLFRVVFRGGADVEWHDFDFKGVHEVILERYKNAITAKAE